MTRIPALPRVAAYAAGVQVATIRQWARRGRISPPDENGCYDLTEIEEWSKRRDEGPCYPQALAGRRRRRVPCEDPQTL